MNYFIICSAAFLVSGLTLFSGFGLGTLLMPAVAIFFPIPVAIAMTAVVHFLNNFFKLFYFGKFVDRTVLVRFAVPAIVFAFLGASLLGWLSHIEPFYRYAVGGREFAVEWIKVVVAVLLFVFVAIEATPKFNEFQFGLKWMPFGGALSGFFGGLSGNQGAFRSAFLSRAGLSRDGFIGTNVVIACLVDMTRLFVYGAHFFTLKSLRETPLVLAATVSAFLGVFVGSRLVKKVTMKTIQAVVSISIMLLAVALGLGIV